jgi:hypothetical protein
VACVSSRHLTTSPMPLPWFFRAIQQSKAGPEIVYKSSSRPAAT